MADSASRWLWKCPGCRGSTMPSPGSFVGLGKTPPTLRSHHERYPATVGRIHRRLTGDRLARSRFVLCLIASPTLPALLIPRPPLDEQRSAHRSSAGLRQRRPSPSQAGHNSSSRGPPPTPELLPGPGTAGSKVRDDPGITIVNADLDGRNSIRRPRPSSNPHPLSNS